MENQTPEVMMPQYTKLNPILWIAIGAVILTIGIGVGLMLGKYSTKQISSYEDCIKAKGSSVQESNPPICVTANDLRFKGSTATLIPTSLPAEASAKEGDPTANWKTYTNKEHGFNLKYPSDWVIDFEIENANILNLSSANSVLHILNFEDKSINTKEYLSKLDRIGSVGVKNTKEAVVGGLNAFQRLEGPFGSGFYLWSTYFKNGDSFFQVTIEPKKGVEVRTEDFDIYNQILSTFKFTKENLLDSTFSVTLPDPFQLMRSTENIASYGFDTVEYLVVTNIPTIKLQSLRPSTECSKLTAGQYCLYSEGTGQTKDIADVTVDGIPAKSFYISGGNDNAYHVVQTTQAPILEFKMFVAGGGLDQRFQNFLATIKFL